MENDPVLDKCLIGVMQILILLGLKEMTLLGFRTLGIRELGLQKSRQIKKEFKINQKIHNEREGNFGERCWTSVISLSFCKTMNMMRKIEQLQ